VKASPAAVGSFVLGGLTLAVLAILLFGGLRLFTPSLRAVVFFPTSVAGLTVGAPVTFRGVQVGSVRKIALRLNVTDRSSIIPTFLELDSDRISWVDTRTPGADRGTDPGIAGLVRAGLRATLSMRSLITGQLGVDLNFRPDTLVPSPGPSLGLPEIPSIPSDLQDLEEKLTHLPLRELVDDLRTTLTHIQTVADVFGDKVGPLADSARQTVDAARETMLATTGAVRTLSTDVSRTLRNIDSLAIDGRQQVALSGRELQGVLASAQRTAQTAETLVASLNSIAAPRSEMRGDLEAALRDLAASASSLRSFTRELERSPLSALRGR
jgi:paraquat-inducible protein B